MKVRTCGRFMGFTIGAMLEEIQTLYQQHNQACFLYLSSEVIKVIYVERSYQCIFCCIFDFLTIFFIRYLGPIQHVQTILQVWFRHFLAIQYSSFGLFRFCSLLLLFLIWEIQIFKLWSTTWQVITELRYLCLQDFTARPDIADDCFLLASRCIRYCPDLFVPTEMFPRLVDCAMAGITIQHR